MGYVPVAKTKQAINLFCKFLNREVRTTECIDDYVNANALNSEQILEANEDPSKYPDLIVRVTGFSTYFASMSKELRQFVVDRIVAGE